MGRAIRPDQPGAVDGKTHRQALDRNVVDDLIEGFLRLMASPDEVTGPVNLGNPGEFTIRELAELTLELTGSASGLKHEPLPEDDPMQRQPDISLARQLLNWQPEVQLEAGLGHTIAYFKQLLEQGEVTL